MKRSTWKGLWTGTLAKNPFVQIRQLKLYKLNTDLPLKIINPRYRSQHGEGHFMTETKRTGEHN